MKPVRIFMGLDGGLNPNVKIWSLRYLNFARQSYPHQKIVVVTDNPELGCWVQRQTGYVVSDFLDGEFERAVLITDKEDAQVDANADGSPKYDFNPKVIRLRSGLVDPGAPMQVRPDSLGDTGKPKGKLPRPEDFDWGSHYPDFIPMMAPRVQPIPPTLRPEMPMPKSWMTDIEGF